MREVFRDVAGSVRRVSDGYSGPREIGLQQIAPMARIQHPHRYALARDFAALGSLENVFTDVIGGPARSRHALGKSGLAGSPVREERIIRHRAAVLARGPCQLRRQRQERFASSAALAIDQLKNPGFKAAVVQA